MWSWVTTLSDKILSGFCQAPLVLLSDDVDGRRSKLG